MAEFQKLGSVLENRGKPVAPLTYHIAHEDAEQEAQAERRLAELVNKPYLMDGQVIYKCSACKDMHFLRADVPFNHPRFGKVRLCPCSPQFAKVGPRWFSPSELYHQS